jgi:hypothetical protein
MGKEKENYFKIINKLLEYEITDEFLISNHIDNIISKFPP